MSSWFSNIKLRFIIGGCIVTIIGVILLLIHPSLSVISYALIIVGITALVIGLIWRLKAKPNDRSTN